MMRAFVAVGAVFGIVSYGVVVSLKAQTATTSIVDVGTARLETTSWGDGEPVILLPGSGYSSTAFGLLGPELARRGFLREHPVQRRR